MNAEFAAPLMDWYRKQRRQLPWRSNPDPYWVWLSEVMLQQTRIKTALPYFHRFIEAFPTIGDLARADINEVLSLWSGLGYYRRARNLHKAAQAIVERHCGRFPSDYRDVLALPGIGRYTAGAICSIAFGQAYPVVDGNVRRVMARFLCIEEELKSAALESLWAELEEVVRSPEVRGRAADFNQALMELGALVCTPRGPDCPACPIASACRARQRGIADDLPVKSGGRKAREFHFLVAVAARDDRRLLQRNDGEPFLKGFWEFPRVPLKEDANIESLFQRLHGLKIERTSTLTLVRHQITHRKLRFHAFAARLQSPLPERGFAWARLGEPDYPIPAYVRKIERALAPAMT